MPTPSRLSLLDLDAEAPPTASGPRRSDTSPSSGDCREAIFARGKELRGAGVGK
jgi:hypothetical protein